MSACTSSFFLHHSRRRPLAAGVAALFVVSATSAWAAPPAVTNCNDSGTGSLRAAVLGAASGDTIDISGLTTSDPGCGSGVLSQITLTTGAIAVGQRVLTISGPGRDALLIRSNAGSHSRVILHNYYSAGNPGHLYLENLNVGYGYITSSGTANGGCISSPSGTVTLTGVRVYRCSATTTAPMSAAQRALGGGVFAYYGLTIANSVIGHATAYAQNTDVRARGGCAMTPGPFDMRNSIVAGCKAMGPIGSKQVGGGALELHGDVTITGSLIANSYSSYSVGGVDISNAAAYTTTISNSTIAYNQAHDLVGGVYADSGHVNINNSTIVLNAAGSYTYTFNAHTYNAAVGVSISSISGTVSLQSTIIANNSLTSNSTQEDLSFGASTGLVVSASNNLVRAYKTDVTLPSGQGNLPQGTCPMLGHGRNNGGTTYTAAPQSGSPVIDAGNNTANDPHTGVPALYDQRGPGYPRVSNSIADIGAHEVQKTDIVFNTEFETGCE
jgi:hypothetical protein